MKTHKNINGSALIYCKNGNVQAARQAHTQPGNGNGRNNGNKTERGKCSKWCGCLQFKATNKKTAHMMRELFAAQWLLFGRGSAAGLVPVVHLNRL